MKTMLRTLLCICLSALLLLTAACSAKTTDYSVQDAYKGFFSEEDDANARELKNLLIAHLEAYNNGDAEGYFSLFAMEKEDLNFNVAQFDAMRQTCVLTYTPEEILTAFIDENNAQALIVMTCRCEDAASGEVLYYYRTELTYTMVRDGKWKVTLQTPGSEEDLMDTLGDETETDTAAE